LVRLECSLDTFRLGAETQPFEPHPALLVAAGDQQIECLADHRSTPIALQDEVAKGNPALAYSKLTLLKSSTSVILFTVAIAWSSYLVVSFVSAGSTHYLPGTQPMDSSLAA
jgi:hypothetical protein